MMNVQKAVDFETFYFLSLLETIEKKAKTELSADLRESLHNFIQFVSSGLTPLDSIEKLARVQGTSDLSIFFSDLLERINEYPPEKTVKNISEYASDFLSIFKELVKDPSWDALVFQETVTSWQPEEQIEEKIAPEKEKKKLNFFEFIHLAIREKVQQHFQLREPASLNLLESLFDRLDNNLNLPEFFNDYRGEEALDQVIELLEKLYQPSGDSSELQKYLEGFWEELSNLSVEMLKLSFNHTELFRTFCSGEALVSARPVEPEIVPAARVEEEPVPSEEPEIEKIELSEEDKNLRYLLRDYIVHEIEEISKEILNQIKTLPSAPGNQETESVVLANFKVLKDLGQIHKYPKIENISLEVSQHLKKVFQEKKILPGTTYSSLEKIFTQFIEYIDGVLDNQPQEKIQLLEQLKNAFINSVPITPVVQRTISFEQTEVLRPVFSEVNVRLIDRLRTSYNAILQDPANADHKSQMLGQLNHLQDWYGIWKLAGAQNILEVLHNWLRNEKQHEKLLKKYNRILETLAVLSDKLFIATPDDWTKSLEKLTLLEKEPEELGVDKSEKALIDVTLRQLKNLSQQLQNNALNFQESKKADLLPSLELLVENCQLTQHEPLGKLFNSMLEGLQSLPDLGEKAEGLFRKTLAKFINQIHHDLSRGIQELSFGNLQRTLKNIFKKVEPAQEGIKEYITDFEALEKESEVPLAEESPEEELKSAFQTEISKHLAELEQTIENLRGDLENDAELLKFGNILHTVKVSAQMMNYPEIAELAGPLENLSELLSEKRLQIRKPFITLGKKALKAFRKVLENKKVDSMKIIESINNYIVKYPIEDKPAEIAKKKSKRTSNRAVKRTPIKTEPPEPAKVELPKKKTSLEIPPASEPLPSEQVTTEPVLRLKEKDPELLEIFRNEAKDNLDNIENSLNLIEKFRYDKQTLQTIDHAVHEVRSAAKMLGFSEVARLVDDLEELIEIINKKEPENWWEIIPAFRKSTQIVRELSEKQQVGQKFYDETAQLISHYVSQLKDKAEAAPKAAEPSRLIPEIEEKKQPSDVMLQTFIQEARQYSQDVNFILIKLEKNPTDPELAEQLMRMLHTLKGSSSMVYLDEMEKLFHSSETLVENLKNQGKSFSAESIDLLFAMVDEVDFMLASLTDQKKLKTKNYEQLLARLKTFWGADAIVDKGKSITPEKPEPKTIITDEYVTVTDEIEAAPAKMPDTHIRLQVKQMDQLLNEAAELVINNNQFKTQIGRFKNFLPRLDLEKKNLQTVLGQLDKIVQEQDRILALVKSGSQNVPALEESQKTYFENVKRVVEHLQKFQTNFSQALQGIKESGKFYDEQLQKISRLSNQIHDEIIQARLVPISILLERFHRPLRDIARKFGKKIKLFIEGESTEIDRAMAEELYEPLLHILRNAIDHGIESPEQRRKAGKTEEGLIKISAAQERNSISISVEDDGKGIDVEAIRERVVELKLLTAEQASKRTAQEMFEFLMYPGFSTASQLSALSGRGVGLDVVRNQVQKVKGDLRIYSQIGKYSRFTIRVPISITVTQAILVEINKNLYAIPLLQVEETLSIGQENLILKESGYVIRQRGSEIPVIKMSDLLMLNKAADSSATRLSGYPIIIVQDEGRKAALLVDKILHREEILIKSLGKILQRIKYVMGGSILADGRVVLVLDIPQIVFSTLRLKEKDVILKVEDVKRLEEEVSLSRKPTKTSVIEKRLVQGRKPLVLVVDDSLSVRKFLSGMLSKHDYEVEVAKNGTAAMELLNQKEFDMMISDLEMPQISGYELIEQIRSDSRWEKLPIIVLTGRASKHIEQHITQLGANEFVVKPFKESDLLEKIGRYIEFKR
jgi:chemotaxis protein histidine kinase CheA/ActR/RegA family two-component response regulator